MSCGDVYFGCLVFVGAVGCVGRLCGRRVGWGRSTGFRLVRVRVGAVGFLGRRVRLGWGCGFCVGRVRLVVGIGLRVLVWRRR